jgi:uncharacterized BrkB/YihY/UPF0761 family membrane protein
MSTALVIILIVLILLTLSASVGTGLVAAGKIEKNAPESERKKFMYAAIGLGVLTLVLLVVLFAAMYHSHEMKKRSE